jgi:hypothetical protein
VDDDRVYLSDGEDGLYLFTFPGPTGVRAGVDVGRTPALHQNYPNPFNPVTTISFTLQTRSKTRLSVFDVTGRLITTIVDDELDAGPHQFTWKAGHSASGVYFYRLTADDYSLTRKMMLLK